MAQFPPLQAIRSFSAAARHASFSRAADELGVTHGAISKQVRLLEAFLGVPLFARAVRQVSLTEAGRELFAEVAPALERIAVAATRLQQAPQLRTGVVRINAGMSFSLRWLIPNLPDFIQAYPNIIPEVATSVTLPARLPSGSFDIVLRRRHPGIIWPEGMSVRPFLHERAIPVAAPDLLKQLPIKQPIDLAAHTLLHANTRKGDWAKWLTHAGVPALSPSAELHFEHWQFALQAALEALGVALGPSEMVSSDISAGRLVPLFSRSLWPPLDAYCYSHSGDMNPAAQAFVEWLVSATPTQCSGTHKSGPKRQRTQIYSATLDRDGD